MGFKNMKRDDHGHVISNDEVDGQKCKHQSGGNHGEPGFNGDKTAKMNKSQYIDYLENEKGWDHEEAKHHAELFGDEAFDDDYEEEFKEDSNYRAGRLVADLENFDWADESLVNRMNNVLNYKNYKVGTLEENIAYNLDEGMSDKEAVEDAIYGMEVYGDQPPEDEFDDDRWGDNLDLNDRKTREILVDDYDKYRASKNAAQDFNRGQTVDAPEKGQGWKKTKMASGTLYEGPNGERYMDNGSQEFSPNNLPKKGTTVRIAKEFGDNSREFEVVDAKEGLKGITIKEKGRDGITYNVDVSQLEGYSNSEPLDGKQYGSSQGKYKYGKDLQNRFYVDDETGYRQYFTRESEARDYADRMNAAQGSSANNNFKEYTDKNGEKVKEFSSDKDAKKWFDEHQNELPDGTVLYGNKVYVGKDSSQPTGTQGSLPRYAIDRFKSGDYDSNTAMEEILKAFPDARSALNWMLSEFKRK